MLRTFFYFSLSIVLVSCSSSETETVISKPLIQKSGAKTELDESSFSNPALICGTTIGELIQQLYKQGNWKELIKFISKYSIEEFGEEAIINAFQKTDFGYSIKLKSKSMLPDGTLELNYQTLKYGTLGILRMYVRIENDTAKLIIQSINPTIQFNSNNGTDNSYRGC